jgi:hypothetical protein
VAAVAVNNRRGPFTPTPPTKGSNGVAVAQRSVSFAGMTVGVMTLLWPSLAFIKNGIFAT